MCQDEVKKVVLVLGSCVFCHIGSFAIGKRQCLESQRPIFLARNTLNCNIPTSIGSKDHEEIA